MDLIEPFQWVYNSSVLTLYPYFLAFKFLQYSMTYKQFAKKQNFFFKYDLQNGKIVINYQLSMLLSDKRRWVIV